MQLVPAPADGVFPDDFYATTNQPTFVRVAGREIEATPAMMDCGIVVEQEGKQARTVRFHELKAGMHIVTGQKGLRIAPAERSTSRTDTFEFITTNISVEQPKSAVIRETAREFNASAPPAGKFYWSRGQRSSTPARPSISRN